MLRIVPHTVPRVGCSYEHFPDTWKEGEGRVVVEGHDVVVCKVDLLHQGSGLWFRIWGAGFRVYGLGFRV